MLDPGEIETLIAVGQIADYLFRLANDFASSSDAFGGDQDQTKENSLSILVPKVSTASERAAAVRFARGLGATILSSLEEHLKCAMAQLHAIWPSMATKLERAVRVGRGVYAASHYTTMTANEMMALLQRIDSEMAPSDASLEPSSRSSLSVAVQRPRKNRLRSVTTDV